MFTLTASRTFLRCAGLNIVMRLSCAHHCCKSAVLMCCWPVAFLRTSRIISHSFAQQIRVRNFSVHIVARHFSGSSICCICSGNFSGHCICCGKFSCTQHLQQETFLDIAFGAGNFLAPNICCRKLFWTLHLLWEIFLDAAFGRTFGRTH